MLNYQRVVIAAGPQFQFLFDNVISGSGALGLLYVPIVQLMWMITVVTTTNPATPPRIGLSMDIVLV